MKCIAIELLTEIRDRLRNLDTLEVRRRKKSARQARYRARQKHVDATNNVDATKEEGKGKENFPPAPPLEKREAKKKGAGEGGDAHAREASSAELPALRLRESRVELVRAYNAKIKGNVDAEYFVDYYADDWPRDWKARLRNWLKEDKKSGRIKPMTDGGAERSPRPTAAPDWTLCAERCANCRGEGCACGVKVPPACEERPRPPEECPNFKKA